ncbi:MAG: hypothetical protein VST67_14370 [Nitrospirota bacterium]|nr:hypothetical protein [Nitrospirota bacterium]
MPKRRQSSSAGGNVQKSPSSKAAAILTREAYMEYVSTAQWRERRWRLFSTFPVEIGGDTAFPNEQKELGQVVQAVVLSNNGHALIIR